LAFSLVSSEVWNVAQGEGVMKSSEITPIVLERAMEKLRQERETFNQQRMQEQRWFVLRLSMGYSAVALLIAIMAVASYILLRNNSFPVSVITAAGSALFVDVLGLLVGVWKIALNPTFLARLAPVTAVDLPDVIESESDANTGNRSDTAAIESHASSQTEGPSFSRRQTNAG
jgi:hypothetical protein